MIFNLKSNKHFFAIDFIVLLQITWFTIQLYFSHYIVKLNSLIIDRFVGFYAFRDNSIIGLLIKKAVYG